MEDTRYTFSGAWSKYTASDAVLVASAGEDLSAQVRALALMIAAILEKGHPDEVVRVLNAADGGVLWCIAKGA